MEMEVTRVRREASGFMGEVGHGGERKRASNVSRTVGVRWKPMSADRGGLGRSGGMTSFSSIWGLLVSAWCKEKSRHE